ncbi:hypothetical protein BHE74_00042011 [Ensete ventricosum]|nr:hypothetical protein GW17_00032967 [Ensete ventricosum]RWW51620.1 hypothetical protein BHE74_00042011 [Ensete ventricosum]RZR89987.1 hypothetical protein BHM03_00017799 [Ensete ventricosum]
MRGCPREWLVPAGAAPAGVGSARSQGCRLQGRPLLQGQCPHMAAPPAREVPPEGSNACCRGSCPRRWRATPPATQGSGDDSDGAVRVREEG